MWLWPFKTIYFRWGARHPNYWFRFEKDLLRVRPGFLRMGRLFIYWTAKRKGLFAK